MLYDLGPLALQRDVTFETDEGHDNDLATLLQGTPFGAMLGGGADSREPHQTMTISVCGDTRSDGDAACRGEHAPGDIVSDSLTYLITTNWLDKYKSVSVPWYFSNKS